MRHSRLAVWRSPRNDLWNNTYVCVLHKLGRARAVEVEPAEPEEEREIQHVWALSVCDISGTTFDVVSVFCDNIDLPSDESGNLLNRIMDSGAEEHVVSLADWKSLGEPLLKPAQVRLRSATGDDSTRERKP